MAPNTTTVAEVGFGRDGSTLLLSTTCHAPVRGRGGITPSAIRAEALKRVPHPRVGAAPPGGTTLVNGSYSITVQASDGAGGTSTATFTIAVTDATPTGWIAAA